ncbi:hypothetical protein NDU88_006423 [Pleurodeles waltl]|uniref:Uncharacterized protein n=1 Tax=Pleurodeles waltl TaxID=8319 RepID=A0AAV7LUV0_PLEWA|nr:hypothetical protein NDU88_006423 [Pleurodeles waltl]
MSVASARKPAPVCGSPLLARWKCPVLKRLPWIQYGSPGEEGMMGDEELGTSIAAPAVQNPMASRAWSPHFAHSCAAPTRPYTWLMLTGDRRRPSRRWIFPPNPGRQRLASLTFLNSYFPKKSAFDSISIKQ